MARCQLRRFSFRRRLNKLFLGYVLQRLFSTFADGWSGAGLLLQRLLVGGVLIYCAISSLTDILRFEIAVPELLSAVAGVPIIAGLWTPVTWCGFRRCEWVVATLCE